MRAQLDDGSLRGGRVAACLRLSPVVSVPPGSSPGWCGSFRPTEVVAIVNTADDDEFHGLYVSPDLDSVTYTLAGASNVAQGWGLEGETFATLDALGRYDVPTWFRLGDKDLATHLFRTAPPAGRRAPLGGDGRDHPGVVARDPAAADDRRPRPHPHHCRRAAEGGRGRPKSSRCSAGSSANGPSRRSSSVRFDGAERARPAPGVLDALRARRHDRHLPVEPGHLDRPDPRRPRHPRDPRGPARPRRGGQPHRRRRARARARPTG